MIQQQEPFNKSEMENLDVWTLIQNGNFEAASKRADGEFEQTGNILSLRNKVYALFHLRQYYEAFELTKRLIELRNGETDTDFIFCGIANWMLGKYTEAIELWKKAEGCKYTDAAGGVELQIVLYFASLKTKDNNLKEQTIKRLKKLLKSKAAKNWPGPLGKYILGDLSTEDLFNLISSIPVLKERQACQAYFVIAIKELENGNSEKYAKAIEDSLSFGASSYLEQFYYLAKGEHNNR